MYRNKIPNETPDLNAPINTPRVRLGEGHNQRGEQERRRRPRDESPGERAYKYAKHENVLRRPRDESPGERAYKYAKARRRARAPNGREPRQRAYKYSKRIGTRLHKEAK